jgi:hypothetical protein
MIYMWFTGIKLLETGRWERSWLYFYDYMESRLNSTQKITDHAQLLIRTGQRKLNFNILFIFIQIYSLWK